MAQRYTNTGVQAKDYAEFPRGEREFDLENIDIIAKSAISWDLDPHFEEGFRVCPDHMWIYVEKGKGIHFDGQRPEPHDLSDGDVIVVPPLASHNQRFPGKERTRSIVIHFTAKHHEDMGTNVLSRLPVIVKDNALKYLRTCFMRAAREYQHQLAGWRRAVETEVWNILIHILRHSELNKVDDKRPAAHPELARLQPALRYLQQHLDDPELSVSSMAARVHLSEVQFRFLFKKVLGKSPQQYLQHTRISRARELLITTRDNMESIARACGYHSPQYFIRVFREVTGGTPKRYRDQDRDRLL